jgi:hypothetical protein
MKFCCYVTSSVRRCHTHTHTQDCQLHKLTAYRRSIPARKSDILSSAPPVQNTQHDLRDKTARGVNKSDHSSPSGVRFKNEADVEQLHKAICDCAVLIPAGRNRVWSCFSRMCLQRCQIRRSPSDLRFALDPPCACAQSTDCSSALNMPTAVTPYVAMERCARTKVPLYRQLKCKRVTSTNWQIKMPGQSPSYEEGTVSWLTLFSWYC